MSDDAQEEMEDETIDKKSSKKLIIIIIMVILFLGGGGLGWVLLGNNSGKKDIKKAKVTNKKKSNANDSGLGQIFSMESFVVNLNDPSGKRYLKTTIDLELSRSEYREEVTSRLPQLRDVILLILSSKTLEDIQGVDGKIALRTELISRINQALKKARIKNLYFTEFVIQ